MRLQAETRPTLFGFAVTVLGVAFFFPDALVVKMIGAHPMDIAVWRGLAAAVVTLGIVALVPGALRSGLRRVFSGAGLAMIVLQGVGSLLFIGSLAATSAANALLILAAAPFIAALLSQIFLGERVDPPTWAAIAAVFAGVAVLASGSVTGGGLAGDAMALGNAVLVGAYYVVLRRVPETNLIVPVALGYLATTVLALPFAPLDPMTSRQVVLLLVSGGVILAGGAALLMLGPRYLPAAEVSMITMLEIVAGPLIVWLVLGEAPGSRSLWGGAIILAAITAHASWRLWKEFPERTSS